MRKNYLKQVIKNKIKANKELTEEEKLREKIKYEIAEELGLSEKVARLGWGGLSSGETGKIGGLMNKRRREVGLPSNEEILKRK